MDTGWGTQFAELNDSDGDGVWTGSGSIAPGTWEWRSVGHWDAASSQWNSWYE